MTRGFVFAGAACALFAATAATPASAQSSPDVAVLAGSCANCHSDGRTSGKIPPIAGRPAATLAALLKAFKGETTPPGTTIMNRLAKGYTDEQIEALAKYFAEKK